MVNKIDKLSNNSNAGILSLEGLKQTPGYPKNTDFEKGLIAVIECDQDIPCNPCENVCHKNAIRVGLPITNLPSMDADKCDGCLKCLSVCPGLCIFAVKKNFSGTESLIYIPYEYLPLPDKGMTINALDRKGNFVCKGKVYKVMKSSKSQKTPIVGITIPGEYYEVVRHFKF